MLICIEGADAVGKNEMSRRLTDALSATRQTCRISFPRYDTVVGGAILRHLKEDTRLIDVIRQHDDREEHERLSSDDPLMFQCMMLADKVHAAKTINMFLKGGGTVVLDRWWQSAYVYGACDGLDEQWLLDTHDALPKADLNILLTLSVEKSQERRPGLRDRYEKDQEKQVRIRQKYIDVWKDAESMNAKMRSYADGRYDWKMVDSRMSRDDVFAEIMKHVRESSARLKMDLA